MGEKDDCNNTSSTHLPDMALTSLQNMSACANIHSHWADSKTCGTICHDIRVAAEDTAINTKQHERRTRLSTTGGDLRFGVDPM